MGTHRERLCLRWSGEVCQRMHRAVLTQRLSLDEPIGNLVRVGSTCSYPLVAKDLQACIRRALPFEPDGGTRTHHRRTSTAFHRCGMGLDIIVTSRSLRAGNISRGSLGVRLVDCKISLPTCRI